ncbi:MAG: hypothetical protein JST92_08055, partial [Deltaproteobacteria bacterium]|nr:hypothetical protein [Deltaproteobacteria bacterium]
GAPTVQGTLVAGQRVNLVYDSARSGCSGTSNGKPAWSTTAFDRVAGGTTRSFFAAGLNPAGGTSTPSFTLPARTGDLEVWFETAGLWGCHAWDSNYGANFHFNVAAPANWPGWMGSADVVISRATCGAAQACDSDRRPLDAGFTYDSWSRQRAAIKRVSFRVWKSGVTDHDDPDLWKKLDVQLHARFDPKAAFATSYVNFDARIGNDARYAFDLGPLDPFVGPGGGPVCPKVPVTASANGQDDVATFEFYLTVNGAELRPSADEASTFKGSFTSAHLASCAKP